MFCPFFDSFEFIKPDTRACLFQRNWEEEREEERDGGQWGFDMSWGSPLVVWLPRGRALPLKIMTELGLKHTVGFFGFFFPTSFFLPPIKQQSKCLFSSLFFLPSPLPLSSFTQTNPKQHHRHIHIHLLLWSKCISQTHRSGSPPLTATRAHCHVGPTTLVSCQSPAQFKTYTHSKLISLGAFVVETVRGLVLTIQKIITVSLAPSLPVGPSLPPNPTLCPSSFEFKYSSQLAERERERERERDYFCFKILIIKRNYHITNSQKSKRCIL